MRDGVHLTASKLLYPSDLGVHRARFPTMPVIDSPTVNYRYPYRNYSTCSARTYSIGVGGLLFAFAAFSTLVLAQDADQKEANIAEAQTSGGNSSGIATEEYRIGVADVLAINVWKEPDHSVASVVVRPDGKISVPLLREINVIGLTPLEAEDLLREKFKEFINNPNVTIIYKEIRSQLVYMTGGVNRPGSLLMRPGMTVWQALYEAGGVSEYGKRKKIYIVRDVGGTRTTIDFDYNAVMKGDVDADLVLRTGDTIVVPE